MWVSGMYVFVNNERRTAKLTARVDITCRTTRCFKECRFRTKFKVILVIIEGYGRIIHANGDYYEGEVRNSKANGEGTYV